MVSWSEALAPQHGAMHTHPIMPAAQLQRSVYRQPGPSESGRAGCHLRAGRRRRQRAAATAHVLAWLRPPERLWEGAGRALQHPEADLRHRHVHHAAHDFGRNVRRALATGAASEPNCQGGARVDLVDSRVECGAMAHATPEASSEVRAATQPRNQEGSHRGNPAAQYSCQQPRSAFRPSATSLTPHSCGGQATSSA